MGYMNWHLSLGLVGMVHTDVCRRPNVRLQPPGRALFSALLCSLSCSHRTWWELMSFRSHTWVIIQTFPSVSLLGPSGFLEWIQPSAGQSCRLGHQPHSADHGLDPFLVFPWGVTNHTEDLAALSNVGVGVAETQNHLVVFRVRRNTYNQV